MSSPTSVVLTGPFDNLQARQIRLLEEAAKLGSLTVLVWPDETVREITGQAPKFPMSERVYFLNAVRYVDRVVTTPSPFNGDTIPPLDDIVPEIWIDPEAGFRRARLEFCQTHGLEYRLLPASQIDGFPEPMPRATPPGRKRIVATGCYDWFHSGHVRFTEEASQYGDLYLIVGHDANIRALKGEGHPLLPQNERRYMVGSIKYVKQALISTGDGWLDAAPEIAQIRPHAYVVNEDGDKGGKRDFCEKHGIEYIVLKRVPAPGLPRRSSTELRGF